VTFSALKINHIEFVGKQRIRFHFSMCLLPPIAEYFLASSTNQAPTFHHLYTPNLQRHRKKSAFFNQKCVSMNLLSFVGSSISCARQPPKFLLVSDWISFSSERVGSKDRGKKERARRKEEANGKPQIPAPRVSGTVDRPPAMAAMYVTAPEPKMAASTPLPTLPLPSPSLPL
jgi:hypothetical protein